MALGLGVLWLFGASGGWASEALQGTGAERVPGVDRTPLDPEEARLLGRQALLQNPGALLAAAVAAAHQGDRGRAILWAQEVMDRFSFVADYAAVLQVEWMLEEGRLTEAVAVARRALAQNPETPLAAEFYEEIGETLWQLDQPEAARAAWQSALNESAQESVRARVALRLAKAQEKAGLDEAARGTYTLIWAAYPVTPEAEIAAAELDRISEKRGRPVLKGKDWRRRGDRLYRKRYNEEALAAYDRARVLGVSASAARSMAGQRARLLFRLRRYPEAVEAFGALPRRDDVPIWYARSLARADRVPEAIEAFEILADEGPSRLAPRARFLGATLLEGRDFNERAQSQYKKLADSSQASPFTDAALWRLGWIAYQGEQNEEALRYFDRLIERKRLDPQGQLRARYWRARTRSRMDPEAAAVDFRAIAQEFPFTYYGWRAQGRAGAGLISSPSPRGKEIQEEGGRLDPVALERVRVLIEAGLNHEARQEIGRLAAQARTLSDRLSVAHLATDAGDDHRAQRLAVDAYSVRLARGPVKRLEDLWWYAWPTAFSAEVSDATVSEASVEPALVYSIMREESGYRPEVISPVGARGLLQIMKPTGEVLARQEGLESFDPDDLFIPRTNIRLGSRYLTDLSEEFNGHLSAAIASYNAGPEAVREWAPETISVKDEDDEWVESIPYEQTRGYVKRVLRSLHVYRSLY